MSRRKLSFVRREFHLLSRQSPDAAILEFKNEIILLCEKYRSKKRTQNEMMFLPNAILNSISKIMRFEALTPLSGEDNEWYDVGEVFQNKRDVRVVKEGSEAIFTDAIVFVNEEKSFVGDDVVEYNGKRIGSKHYIKGFPFEPKTFYVDVITEDGLHILKDPDQIADVILYYNMKFVENPSDEEE